MTIVAAWESLSAPHLVSWPLSPSTQHLVCSQLSAELATVCRAYDASLPPRPLVLLTEHETNWPHRSNGQRRSWYSLSEGSEHDQPVHPAEDHGNSSRIDCADGGDGCPFDGDCHTGG